MLQMGRDAHGNKVVVLHTDPCNAKRGKGHCDKAAAEACRGRSWPEACSYCYGHGSWNGNRPLYCGHVSKTTLGDPKVSRKNHLKRCK